VLRRPCRPRRTSASSSDRFSSTISPCKWEISTTYAVNHFLGAGADAIARAVEMNPDSMIHVERMRNTDAGSRDKWRKI